MPPTLTRTAPSLIGHERDWRLLMRLHARGRLPAAVLLSGPPSVGKATVAQSFARSLLGVEQASRVLEHPDLLRVEPTEDTQWRATVRDLLRRVHERPVHGNLRVVLLTDVDRLSSQATALLLKAVEDAPTFAVFLLSAVHAGLVAPTLRSRALVLELSPVPSGKVADALTARGLQPTDARRVADLCGGRPGLALRLAADAPCRQRYEEWDRALDHCQRRARSVALPNDSAQAEEFLVFLQSRLRGGGFPPALVRRSREATAMLRQHVPANLVLEYLLAPLA